MPSLPAIAGRLVRRARCAMPETRPALLVSAAVLAGTLSVSSASSYAVDVTGETLEVLVHQASAVGEYRVVASPAAWTPTEWVRATVQTTLTAALYGAPPSEETIPITLRREEFRTRLPAAGSLLLVFFPPDPEAGPERIPLADPDGGKSPVHWGAALTADFGVLEDAPTILARVRMAIAAKEHPSEAECRDLIVEESVPDTTAAFRALWNGGRAVLRSPFLSRHRRVLRALVEGGQGVVRARAACLLARCSPGDLSDALLRDMLDDPGSETAWTGEEIHPARGVAYLLLRGRGRNVEPPPEYREDDRLDLPCGEAFLVSFADRLAMAAHPPSASFRPALRETVPEYPLPLLEGGVEGRVVVTLAVEPSGGVAGTRVADVVVDAPPPAIATELIAAARTWRFRPLTADGKPVATTVIVPLRVSGGDDAPPPARFLEDRPYDAPCAVRAMVLPWPSTLSSRTEVPVEVDVDEWGGVLRARAASADGTSGRAEPIAGAQAILDAALTWTFTPATVGGIPERATLGLVLHPPGGRLAAETGVRCRLFPEGGVEPDGPVEIVDAPLPGHVGIWGWEAMTLVVRVDEEGRVTDAAVPSRARFRPLAEASLAVSRDWEFAPVPGDPDRVCEVRVPFAFRLPTYVPGVGLVRGSTF